MNVKKRIEMLIDMLNINKKTFAISIGVSPGNVSDWINPIRNANPSTDALFRISEIYNVNLNWLLSGKGAVFLSSDNDVPLDQPLTKKELDENYYINRIKDLEKQCVELKKNIRDIEQCNTQDRKKIDELSDKNQNLNNELTSRLKELIECKDLIIKLQTR